MPASDSKIEDKHGEPINVGDTVAMKSHGGRQYGEVVDLLTTKEQTDEVGAKNPPKVLYDTQTGHRVWHNPGALVHGTDPTK
uniref:Hypervirulence associated protein TUDOR domain-containing protein n=1 Tax=Schizophyllum commune (strain H4-8 / FGSC 9210) TaxID=578458 RepID=D8PKV2_SCHCM